MEVTIRFRGGGIQRTKSFESVSSIITIFYHWFPPTQIKPGRPNEVTYSFSEIGISLQNILTTWCIVRWVLSLEKNGWKLAQFIITTPPDTEELQRPTPLWIARIIFSQGDSTDWHGPAPSFIRSHRCLHWLSLCVWPAMSQDHSGCHVSTLRST